MNDYEARELAEELRLLARHEARWKPLLHRAARALEIPAIDRMDGQAKAHEPPTGPGRFGGRKPFAKPFDRPTPQPLPQQEALF